ncbi:MAG: class I SAM-dependent methyltransferase [Candidatus Omnitrophica bacterium]|nr:class I SAM-dependent methyltransferase [Candidatus Omnitrophota bacterium]
MIFNLEFFKKKPHSTGASSESNTLEYWRSRARKFGKQAVISIDHPVDHFEHVKNRDLNILFPYLQKFLTGKETLIMDFGCGVGRFTAELAKLGRCKAVGVDPTEELLKLAPKSKNVSYFPIKNGEISLPNGSVDVIWIYAVLGCITEDGIKATCQQLARVLKENGLLFLVENTTETPDSKHYHYRSAKKYMQMINFAQLTHVHDYFDKNEKFEETFSILVGRKKQKVISGQ